MKYEKMSKSKGNVITPDEVIYGIHTLDEDFSFHFSDGKLADLNYEIWQNKLNDGFFYTATRFGKIPVFLHEGDDAVPVLILINGIPTLQHPTLTIYWNWWKERLNNNPKYTNIYNELVKL